MESGPPLCKLHHKQYAGDKLTAQERRVMDKLKTSNDSLWSFEPSPPPPISARKTDPIGYERRMCGACSTDFYARPHELDTDCSMCRQLASIAPMQMSFEL